MNLEGDAMNVVGLTWGICALCTLLAVMTSMISYAPPGPSRIQQALPIIFTIGSALASLAAISLTCLPLTHPIRKSRAIWWILVVLISFLVAMAVVG